MAKSTNITKEFLHFDKYDRAKKFNQKPCVIWFTGLSGSGKSTLSKMLDQYLLQHNHLSYVLDGDNIRHGLNKNLGFTMQDRDENIRRIGEVANLMMEAGLIVLCSFISPQRSQRNKLRNSLDENEFFEIHVNTPLSVCEERDDKGLYKRARAGEIKNFTGIDSPYEAPESPELILDTSRSSEEECLVSVIDLMKKRRVIY